MAMYVFQELKPKIFYFTYCLQEIGNYIKFLEESNGKPTTPQEVRDNVFSMSDSPYITDWSSEEYGYSKKFSSDFKKENLPIDNRVLFLVNNLKATFHYCFTQYKMFNNIEEEVNLDKNFLIKKVKEGFDLIDQPYGKYTARLYVNNSFAGGGIKIPGLENSLNADAGSIIIAPSNVNISADPAFKTSRYIGYGYWI